MTKKEYVLKLLDALHDTWPIANGLKVLLNKNLLDDATIDALQHIFAQAVHTVANKAQQTALQKSITFLHKLQESEAHEPTLSDDDLEAMLQAI